MFDATQGPRAARPTLYKGIRMRSRLEADFARWLDSPKGMGITSWEYEPQCFASPAGQYLPDFRLLAAKRDQPLYAEIKPADFPGDAVDAVLTRMQIIWASEPTADLALIFWPFGGDIWRQWLFSTGSEGIWLLDTKDLTIPWPGLNQLGFWFDEVRNPRNPKLGGQ